MTTRKAIHKSLTLLVFGPSKSGKTTLAVTAPAPRLVLDVEHGVKFVPGLDIIGWDPVREAPPEEGAEGGWDTCLVSVRDYNTVGKTYQWLQSGKHPFNSVIIDSVSELQAKVVEQISGRDAVKMQQWGEIFRHMGGLMRDLRDLTAHPVKPLSSVVMTAMSRTTAEGQAVPYLQGQAGVIAPYLSDITGYLALEGGLRKMRITNSPEAAGGERVGGRLGTVVEQDDLNIQTMMDRVFSAQGRD
jgi:hypothetical protein